jgi:hypothetical protein
MNGFELAHTFVVFRPGAAGSFLSGLLATLYSNNFDDLIFSKKGNAHAELPATSRISPLLCCGRLPELEPVFNDFESKVKYYRELIEADPYTYFRTYEPSVTCTHIFANIPLYKVLFPNSKIIVITDNTIEEKAATLLMLTIKFFLEKADGPAMSYSSSLRLAWIAEQTERILTYIGYQYTDITDIIANNMYEPSFSSILLYFSLKADFDIFKSGINRSWRNLPLPDLTDCVTLPYSCIMKGNSEVFLRIIQSIHDIKFTDTQKQYALRNFTNYHLLQDANIMKDPIEFFNKLEDKVIVQLSHMIADSHK